MDWAPASLVAVPITVAPWAASAWAMACPIPRLAPVTSATFPSRLISSSFDETGDGVGKAVDAVQIMGGHALGAALVQTGQHLARAALDQVGDALGGNVFDTLYPAHRAVQLLDQLLPQPVQVCRRPGGHVLYQGDLRRLPGQPGEILGQLLSGGTHQRAMGRHADRQRDGALGTRGLAGLDGALHGSSLTGDDYLARRIEIDGTDHLALGCFSAQLDNLLISQTED